MSRASSPASIRELRQKRSDIKATNTERDDHIDRINWGRNGSIGNVSVPGDAANGHQRRPQSIDSQQSRIRISASLESLNINVGDQRRLKKRKAVTGGVASLASTDNGADHEKTELQLQQVQSEPGHVREADFSFIYRATTGTNADPDAVDPETYAIKHHRENLFRSIKLKEPNVWSKSLKPWDWDWGVLKSIADTQKKRNATDEENVGPGERQPEKHDQQRSYRLSIAEMQRMRLRKLQGKLIKHAVALQFYEEEPADWEADIEAFVHFPVKAFRDYDYMTSCSQYPKDPFLVSGERKVDNYVLQEAMKLRAGGPTNPDLGEPLDILGPREKDNQPIGGTRSETLARAGKEGFKSRVGMAALGGAFLVGPMWLMVLHNTLYTTLISTTVLVTMFGVIMAYFVEKPIDVLSATAAYAAVLVVFVGLNN